MPTLKSPEIGQRHHRLVIIECIQPSKGDANNGGRWKCQCDCGKFTIVNGYRWMGNHSTKSCGCLNGQLLAESNKRRGNPRLSSINLQYTTHYDSCKRYNFIPLTRTEWENIVFKPCHYCGEIDIRKRQPSRVPTCNKYNKFTQTEEEAYTLEINGIDRVDPTKGYIEGNCVPCCRMCNIMKNGYSVEEFFQRVKRVYEKNNISSIPIEPICYYTSNDHYRSKRKT